MVSGGRKAEIISALPFTPVQPTVKETTLTPPFDPHDERALNFARDFPLIHDQKDNISIINFLLQYRKVAKRRKTNEPFSPGQLLRRMTPRSFRVSSPTMHHAIMLEDNPNEEGQVGAQVGNLRQEKSSSESRNPGTTPRRLCH